MSQNNQKQFKTFEDFTNLYELSKTLRFELIPINYDEKNKKLIEDRKATKVKEASIIEKDEYTAKNIKAVKFYLDIFHRDFIKQSLCELKFEKENLEKYYSLLQNLEDIKRDASLDKKGKNKKHKSVNEEIKKLKNILLSEVGEFFTKENNIMICGEEVILSKGILLKKEVMPILKEIFTKEKIEELRKQEESKDIKEDYPDIIYNKNENIFDLDFGYLGDFNKNREHIYSLGGKKGAIATRIIDNLKIFCDNKRIFEEKYKGIDIDFSETEKYFDIKIEKVFNLDYFNSCLTQGGMNKYKKILGGESLKQERKEKIKGLNEIINQYVQKKKQEYNNLSKEERGNKKFNKKAYPTFKSFQKQILSEILRKEIIIESDYDLINEINAFIINSEWKIKKAQEIVNFVINYKSNNLDLEKIYLPKNKINSLANKFFKEPDKFGRVYRSGKSNIDVVSIGVINKFLEEHNLEYKDFYKNILLSMKDKNYIDKFLCLWKREINILFEGGETVIKGGKKENIIDLQIKKNILVDNKLPWFIKKVDKQEKMRDDEEGEFCLAVLDYSQAVLDITSRAEIFRLNEKQENKIKDNKDGVFYPFFDEFTNDDFVPFLYHDRIGNYLKKRSKNTKKDIKMYFNEGHLLDGWDINMEPQYLGFLLRKNNDYFVGIINKEKGSDIFYKKTGNSIERIEEAFKEKEEQDDFKKIEYKQLGIGKIEGIIFPRKSKKNGKKDSRWNDLRWSDIENDKGTISRAEEFNFNENIFNLIQEYERFKEKRAKDKNLKFDKDKQNKLLRYYIECLGVRDDWKRFNFEFKKPEEYKDKDEFISLTQRQSYWINPVSICEEYLYKRVKNGDVFLFKIHNKDWYDTENKVKNGNRENIHTKFFHELFSPENLNTIKEKDYTKSIFELDGKAEIRFRRKTDEAKLKYYEKNGEVVTYDDKRDSNEKKFVIQHRRFAKDTFILHLKTRLNFGMELIDKQEFNKEINKKLFIPKQVKILGLDRGENNLIYYCLLNEKGVIEKAESLNKVGERVRKIKNEKGEGKEIKEKVNYYQKLVDREEQRDWEKKHWQKIAPIKDLKKGYLDNVIYEIVKMITENIEKDTAIMIVLEDLSQNFKKTRFFREIQIYQNFENALINKLNYLVDKKIGNYRKAYQLAFKVDSVSDMEKNKQIGVIFYVNASYTSKICPKCGWRKRIYSRRLETKKKFIKELEDYENKKLSGNGIKISFQQELDRFKFEYKWGQEYQEDGDKKKYNGTDELFSNVYRTRWDKNIQEPIRYDDKTENSITNSIKNLLKENQINILADINSQIIKHQKELKEKFFDSLAFYFHLIAQIRNFEGRNEKEEKNGNDKDYIQCPKCGFNSKESVANLEKINNGDANGAYNIARKGFMLLERIKKDAENFNPYINNKDWDDFTKDWDSGNK